MRQLTTILLLCLALTASAQHTVGEVFKVMPDSIMPLLTKNNRLDMIDFLDAKMKAVVTNLLEGESEMTVLTDDSLSIRMNGVATYDVYLKRIDAEYDSCHQVICMKTTYSLPSTGAREVTARIFSICWRPLDIPLSLVGIEPCSTLMQRDVETFKEKESKTTDRY